MHRNLRPDTIDSMNEYFLSNTVVKIETAQPKMESFPILDTNEVPRVKKNCILKKRDVLLPLHNDIQSNEV